MIKSSSLFPAALLALSFTSAWGADIEVRDAWVRGTVPAQKASGAFMSITSRTPARLVAAASPVAGAAEIHNMKMEGGVMKMSAVDGIELAANRAVALAPGGYHVMLLDLKRALKAGERVPLKLTFEVAGKRETLDVDAEVRALTANPHEHAH